MNLDPRNSKNYDKAIEKTSRMNQGARHSVGDERLTIKQIAEIIGKKVNTTGILLKTYTAEKLIAREKRREKKTKSANILRQEP
ncbi:hypothetical protein KAR91_81225 [Candidatus Pacearchaeota archaeon]|nr:hypothetical protein [Candidatus Pacearchaeota archaeon]